MTQHLQTHILSKFDIVKKIGSGAYGHVWKVIDHKDKKIKALKKNFDAFNNSTDAQRTYREIMFLMQLSHPNIVKLEQVIRADNNNDIYLIFQHMDIDLFTLTRQGILQQKHKKWILYQIIKSIYYLHSASLIHRDLKPSNILVNQNCDAKLCDFGLVRSLEEQQQNHNVLTQYIATRWYRAPEILVGSPYYSKSIDVWGLGCLIGQMFKGKPIFPGTSTINQMQRILGWTGFPKQSQIRSLKSTGTQMLKGLTHIKKINKKQFIPSISQLALDLMSKCMQFDPQKRIKIQQIIKHPYLKQYYNKSDIKIQNKKIKVSIDDNQRLSLKQYRNLIYQKIKSKDIQADRRQSVDKTLYRIRQASTKKHIVSVQSTSEHTQKQIKQSKLYNKQKQDKQSKLYNKQKQDKQSKLYNKQDKQSKLHSKQDKEKYINKNKQKQKQSSRHKNIKQQSQKQIKQHLSSQPNDSNINYSNIQKKLSSKLQNSINRYSNSLSAPKNMVPKKKSHSIIQKSKHLKTMQRQWDPIQTKKAVNLRQQMKKTKNILTKLKRSVYQIQIKKPNNNKRIISQNQHHINENLEREQQAQHVIKQKQIKQKIMIRQPNKQKQYTKTSSQIGYHNNQNKQY